MMATHVLIDVASDFHHEVFRLQRLVGLLHTVSAATGSTDHCQSHEPQYSQFNPHKTLSLETPRLPAKIYAADGLHLDWPPTSDPRAVGQSRPPECLEVGACCKKARL